MRRRRREEGAASAERTNLHAVVAWLAGCPEKFGKEREGLHVTLDQDGVVLELAHG